MESFLNDRVRLFAGDCIEVLATLPESSVDAVCCDPPYHLQSIVKRFGADGAMPAKAGKTGAFARASAGFCGQRWDGGDIAFRKETWDAVYRVLKPGAYMIAMSGTRTYHKMATAIEEAGFAIYDQIFWAYGSGFPKSKNIALSFESTLCERREASDGRTVWFYESDGVEMATEPPFRCVDANEWWGWGTSLKPAVEPACLARKPVVGTIVENIKRYGTGAINIDACRVPPTGESREREGEATQFTRYNDHGATNFALLPGVRGGNPNGRWPANLITDGSPDVLSVFPDAPGQQRAVGPLYGPKDSVNVYGDYGPRQQFEPRSDCGSAARFFYTPKADSDERVASSHPTVKPIDLNQYFVRLITPPGGWVLDMFAGTGTTGEAAYREGCRAILIEREPQYIEDIRRRMALVNAGPLERSVAIAKAKDEPTEALPLFAAADEVA